VNSHKKLGLFTETPKNFQEIFFLHNYLPKGERKRNDLAYVNFHVSNLVTGTCDLAQSVRSL
jgi:hypothetical protein